MTIKDFIQDNPFRVMGAFVNDPSNILSSNNSRMKAFAAIGKDVVFPQDMVSVFGTKPDRHPAHLAARMAALSSPMGRLLNGMFWFMNLTATDAKALAALAQNGDLLEARRTWEEGEQNMSSIQNQLICCLLKDPRSYSKAVLLAQTLYGKYGNEFIVTVSNGFEVITSDKLMPTFLAEIVRAADGACQWWDKAVKRQGSKEIDLQWSEAKAARHIGKLQDALNVAKTTEIHTTQDNYDIACALMMQALPHLRELKELSEQHPVLLSRYATIADETCEEVLNREIEYYNHIGWFDGKAYKVLFLERFCYRYAATVRFKERCKLNINITLGRPVNAPLFPNGKPDNLKFSIDRRKRNEGLCAILAALKDAAE